MTIPPTRRPRPPAATSAGSSPTKIPPDFQEPLKGLAKGDLAKPVRTRFGVHILRVVDRVYARPITMKEDYDRIARLALAKKQDEIFGRWVGELAAETYIERK